MKQFFFFVTSIYLASCATSESQMKIVNLDFEATKSFILGVSEEKDIVQKIGDANSRVEEDQYTELAYLDKKTGLDRMTLRFLKPTGKLDFIMWIPYEKEPESELSFIKKMYPQARFKEHKENLKVHYVPDEVYNYVDATSGITVRFDKTHDHVEVIGRYTARDRLPAKD